MKTLFLAVTAHLQSLGIFKFIDMDKGQLDSKQLRPAVAFPCALVKCSFPSFDDFGNGIKNRNGSVRIRLAFDSTGGRTSTSVAKESREQSLGYIDTSETVFEAFRQFAPETYTMFEIKEFVPEDRSDGVVLIRMSFSTNRIDT